MLTSAALSEAQLRTIRDGVQLNFREDGRTLLQQRPVHVYIEHMRQQSSKEASETGTVTDSLSNRNKQDLMSSNYLFVHKASASTDAHNIIVQQSYNGSKLRVESDGTVILVTAVPTVIQVCTFNSTDNQNNNNSNKEQFNEADEQTSKQHQSKSNNTTKQKQSYQQQQQYQQQQRQKNGKEKSMVHTATKSYQQGGNGQLYIHIDAVSQVVDYYAHLLGGKASRYRRSYLALLANLIHATFGANGVNCTFSGAGQSLQQQQLLAGIAAAERVYENEGEQELKIATTQQLLQQQQQQQQQEYQQEEDEEIDDQDNIHSTLDTTTTNRKDNSEKSVKHNATRKYKSHQSKESLHHSNTIQHRAVCMNGLPCQTGFPARELYIGSGYAFRIDVHLHVLQGLGGNIASLLALTVHVALKTLQLPQVTLQTSAAGVTVQVDQNKPYPHQIHWNELPLLVTLPIYSSHHYLIDPSAHEQLAFPQQCAIASNARGQVCAMQFIQLPSRQKCESVLNQQQQKQQYQQQYCEQSNANGDTTQTRSLPPNTTKASSVLSSNTGQTDMTHTTFHKHRSVLKQGNEIDSNEYEFNLSDCAALMQDGVHICQSMILDCDKVLDI